MSRINFTKSAPRHTWTKDGEKTANVFQIKLTENECHRSGLPNGTVIIYKKQHTAHPDDIVLALCRKELVIGKLSRDAVTWARFIVPKNGANIVSLDGEGVLIFGLGLKLRFALECKNIDSKHAI